MICINRKKIDAGSGSAMMQKELVDKELNIEFNIMYCAFSNFRGTSLTLSYYDMQVPISDKRLSKDAIEEITIKDCYYLILDHLDYESLIKFIKKVQENAFRNGDENRLRKIHKALYMAFN